MQEEGFAQPKAVKDATMSYQHDSNKMELFVEKFLEQEKDAECRTSAVYQAYRNWWIFCGEQPEFQSGTPHNRYDSPQTPKLAKNTKFWNGLKNNYLNIWYS